MKAIRKIVITGPESTGKTELAAALSIKYNALYIPEYARQYVENLDRKYTYADVEEIARQQIELESEFIKKTTKILFYDTYLIITKVWFDVVFHKHPDWLDNYIQESQIDLYLLCNTDLPWIADGIRENGGEMRERLFEIYRDELDKYNFQYRIISGNGTDRTDNAINHINNFFGL